MSLTCRHINLNMCIVVRCVNDHGGCRLSSNVMVQAKNTSDKPIKVIMTDNGYKAGERMLELGSGQESAIPIESSKLYGWYDFTVAVKGAATV